MLYENKNCQIMTNTRFIFSSWQTSTSMGLTNYWSLKLPLKQLGGYMTQKKHRRFVGPIPVQNFSTFFFGKNFFFLQSQFYFVFLLIKMFLCENVSKSPKIISKNQYFKQIAGKTGFCRNLSGTLEYQWPIQILMKDKKCKIYN